MNLTDVSIVIGLVLGVGGAVGTPATNMLLDYADQRYVTVASQNLKLLYDVEDEMAAIQKRIDNGTATPSDMQRMATLKERKRNLIK